MFEHKPFGNVFIYIFAIALFVTLFAGAAFLDHHMNSHGKKNESSAKHTAIVIGKQTDEKPTDMMIPVGQALIPVSNSKDIYFISLKIPELNEEIELEVGKELYHYVKEGDERQVAISESDHAWLVDEEKKTTDPKAKQRNRKRSVTMPKHIKPTHVGRMFPFEFYEELSEQLKAFTLLNPAFILRGKLDLNKGQRKMLFEQEQKRKQKDQLTNDNLIQVEPFGELLILEPCCTIDDKNTFIQEPKNRSQLPLSFIVVQLYDSTDAPVFANDVTEDSIKQVPEVLWDDPNLLIGIVSFTQEEPNVAIIKIPERIENQIFETINKDNRT